MFRAPIYAHVILLVPLVSRAVPDVCEGPVPPAAVVPLPEIAVARYALPPLITESPTVIVWPFAQLAFPCDALSCIFCTSSAT